MSKKTRACPFGKTVLGAWCTKTSGLTLKIMCCDINILTGCCSCGGSCDDEGKTGTAEQKKQRAEAQRQLEEAKRTGGASLKLKCEEKLVGNGASYRGCQMETWTGYRCQNWRSQRPHAHEFGQMVKAGANDQNAPG